MRCNSFVNEIGGIIEYELSQIIGTILPMVWVEEVRAVKKEDEDYES